MTCNLYNKKHLVIISTSKEKRKIVLKIEIESRNCNVNTRDLFIRLIDPDSLSFLFCLRINDDNFQELKQQQGLLVDLSGFGQRLIDLLELCLSEENSECPKYIMNLCGTGDLAQAALPGANWTLNFIETNPFKHLTHLSLRFVHSDIDQFKNYLVECVHGCRMEIATLASKLKSTETTLSKKLQDTELALATVTDELQQQRISSRLQLDELRGRLEQQTNTDKEKLLETENYYKTKHSQDRLDWENNFAIKIHSLEAKNQDLERFNKCLGDENSKLEIDIRELKSKLENADENCSRSSNEIQSLRRGKELCEKAIHDLECQSQKQHTRVAVLEQEIRDKDQMLSRTQELYTAEQEAKNRYLEESQQRARQIEKLDKAVKNFNVEVTKGNEIIHKLQSDIKHYHSKIKLRTQITTEQEKVIVERDAEIKALRTELEGVRKDSLKQEEEIQQQASSLEQMSKKLEDANHVIKTNENVINWLNRQVTEYELMKQQKPGFSGRAPSSHHGAATFSTCTDSTIKYRPTSVASNPSDGGDHFATNSVLGGVGYRSKLLPTSNPASSSTQVQAPPAGRIDSCRNYSALPTSVPDMADAKHSMSGDRAGPWNSGTLPAMRHLVGGTVPILEESEPNNSTHQQSLSSAYFPKPLLGPR